MTSPRAMGLTIALAATAFAAEAAADMPSDPIHEPASAYSPVAPVKEQPDGGMNKPLFWSGFGLGAGGYVIPAGVAAVIYLGQAAPTMGCDDETSCDLIEPWPLFIPLAGPTILIGTENPTGGQTALLVAASGAQVLGIAMMVIGLADSDDETVATRVGDVELQVAPTVAGGPGFALQGAF